MFGTDKRFDPPKIAIVNIRDKRDVFTIEISREFFPEFKRTLDEAAAKNDTTIIFSLQYGPETA